MAPLETWIKNEEQQVGITLAHQTIHQMNLTDACHNFLLHFKPLGTRLKTTILIAVIKFGHIETNGLFVRH